MTDICSWSNDKLKLEVVYDLWWAMSKLKKKHTHSLAPGVQYGVWSVIIIYDRFDRLKILSLFS